MIKHNPSIVELYYAVQLDDQPDEPNFVPVLAV